MPRIELHINTDEPPAPGNPTSLIATIDAAVWDDMTYGERGTWVGEKIAEQEHVEKAWLVNADDAEAAP